MIQTKKNPNIKLNKYNEILLSPEEFYIKIKKMNDLLDNYINVINKLNKNIDLGLIIKDGKITKEKIYLKFLNIDIKNININIWLNSIIKFLSPEKNTNNLINKWYNYLDNIKNSLSLEDINYILNINNNIEKEYIFSSIIDINLKPKNNFNIITITGIEEPSFYILKYLTKEFNIIDYIEIKLLRSDRIQEINKNVLTIYNYEYDYSNSDILIDIDNKNLLESSLKAIYKKIDKNPVINISINIYLKDNTNIYKKVILLEWLKEHGLISDIKNDINVKSININKLELFALTIF